MIIKGITDEDFVNYKVPSMYIATATCSFKCDKEYGTKICQNSELANQPDISISLKTLVDRFVSNPITKAVIFGGLEPLDDYIDIFTFISLLRNSGCEADVIIYTGYNKDEVWLQRCLPVIQKLNRWYDAKLTNIVIKWGRYIPNQQPHYDPVLGVYLASDNQYAERIS